MKKPVAKNHARGGLIQARVNNQELQKIVSRMWAVLKKDNMGEYIRLACLNYKPEKGAK